MTNQRSSKRQSFPPYDESSKLSRRDQALVRVEKLLSEQFIPPLVDEAQMEEDGPVDLVDLDEAVETAQLPPEARPLPPRILVPPKPAATAGGSGAKPETPAPKSRLTLFSAVLQGAILLFVLVWVFLFGILVGRGHLWQSGPGHDLIIWVEQKAGWTAQPAPEVILKKDGQPDETTSEAPGTEAAPANDGQAAATSESSGSQEEMPVWDWPGWTPGPPDNPLGGSEDPAPAATEPSASFAPAEPAAGPETPPGTGTPAAESQAPAAEASSEAAEEETWPTAIEDNDSGAALDFQPPSDQDDYEALLEAAEVPHATLAEGSPLPPEQADIPGTGKFAVQVGLAKTVDEAKKQAAQLAEQGFKAYYYESGGQFPVRVGRFATRQDADEAKLSLEQLGHTEATVSVLND